MALNAKQITEINNAYNRPGGQTATDKTNIAYAITQGWKPPTAAAPVAPVVPPATTNSSLPGSPDLNAGFVTPPGSTPAPVVPPAPVPPAVGSAPIISSNPTGLSDLQKNELDFAYNRPGGQTEIDKKNIAYAIKYKGYKPPSNGGTDFSNVNSVADANAEINNNQTNDVADATKTDAPPVRQTIDDIMKGLKETIAPDVKAPETPNYTDAMAGYRTEYGVNALEGSLNDLRAQEQEIMDIKKSRIDAERGKTVASNVISGRIGMVEQQENERLAVIQRSISNATNQLNTKYNIINTLMKTKQQDYEAASEAYDKQMSQNITLYNAAKNIEEEQKSYNDKEVDNARASAQIMLNAYQASGTTYDGLSATEKSSMTKLSVTAGLGADFFSNVLKASAGKEILTQIKSDDDTMMSIIYKDGTTKTFSTGLKAKPKAGSTGGLTKTELKAQQLEDDRMNVQAEVGAITGEDFKVDPSKMIAIRKNIALNSPELLTWFDNAYEPETSLNPQNYPAAVRNNSWNEAAATDVRKATQPK